MAKTSIGLVEYCIAQVGRPYWYGTYGQIATERLYRNKKEQYPRYYEWADDYPDQYGQKVHDCTGLTEGYLMSDGGPDSVPVYRSEYDYSANGLRRACKVSGDISDMPEIPGILVFYPGHTGVYIGNGEVVEARGHAYGVVKTLLHERPWETWGKHPDIEYPSETKTCLISMPVLKKGHKHLYEIRLLQYLLSTADFKGKDGKIIDVDGSYGGNTEYAVKRLQELHGLEADGICGIKTWTVILKGAQ